MRTLISMTLIAFVHLSMSTNANATEIDLAQHFSSYSEESPLEMDFSVVNEMLHAGVIYMGYSTRKLSERPKEIFGTRFRHYKDRATENEANRFFYESLVKQQQEIDLLKQSLELIPEETPLNLYSKEEQLAYWLNLYNVSLINEVAKIYPKYDLQEYLYGEQSILENKIITVNNIKLSLNDIQYNILQKNYDNDPLIIYGLYQGNIGGPNIRRKAYTGYNVYKSLGDNAFEFINSNRGTQFNGEDGEVRISQFYQRNESFFPDFENDLKQHLLTHAKKTISENIQTASSFNANIKNWKIADLYGSKRKIRPSAGTQSINEAVDNELYTKNMRLLELMRIRAVNLGGGSVTVTDIETDDEDELPEVNDN